MVAGLLVMSVLTGLVYGSTAAMLGFSVTGVIMAYGIGGIFGLLLGAFLAAIAGRPAPAIKAQVQSARTSRS